MLRRTLVLGAVLLAACGGESVDPSVPTELTKLSGDGQSATAGSALAQPLEVLVTNIHDEAVAGVTVNWAIETGAGALSGGSSITDDQGRARVNWTLGAIVGVQEVRVFSGSLDGSPAFFRATASDPGGGGGGPPQP